MGPSAVRSSGGASQVMSRPAHGSSVSAARPASQPASRAANPSPGGQSKASNSGQRLTNLQTVNVRNQAQQQNKPGTFPSKAQTSLSNASSQNLRKPQQTASALVAANPSAAKKSIQTQYPQNKPGSMSSNAKTSPKNTTPQNPLKPIQDFTDQGIKNIQNQWTNAVKAAKKAEQTSINNALKSHPGASQKDLAAFTKTNSYKSTPQSTRAQAMDKVAVLSAAAHGSVTQASKVRLTKTAQGSIKNTLDGILAGRVSLQVTNKLTPGAGAQYQKINGVPTMQAPPNANDNATLYGITHEYQHAVSDHRFGGKKGGGIGSFLEEYRAVFIDRSLTYGDSPIALGKDLAAQTKGRFTPNGGSNPKIYADIKNAYQNVPGFKKIMDNAINKMQSGAAINPEKMRTDLLNAYNADKTGTWKKYVNPDFLKTPSSTKNVW